MLVDITMNHPNISHVLCTHITYYNHIICPIIFVSLTCNSKIVSLKFCTLRILKSILYLPSFPLCFLPQINSKFSQILSSISLIRPGVKEGLKISKGVSSYIKFDIGFCCTVNQSCVFLPFHTILYHL